MKFGIIGGGQLARMLAHKAQQIGMDVYVLSENESDPAAQVVRRWVQGSPNDLPMLKSFLEKVDVATFESEFLDAEKVRLASEFSNTSVVPNVSAMASLQNRKTQKALLDEVGVPTAPWVFVEHAFQAAEVLTTLNVPMILKKCRFGYDGYGTHHVQHEAELQEIFSKKSDDGFIAEPKIKFKRELAFMMVRDRFGKTLSLPLVESLQRDSKCLWVKGPVTHSGFKKIESKMKRLLQKVNYVGVMGVELFDTGRDLMVNELAPRVHNSGHFTMNALDHDQFLLHVMVVAGLKLPARIELLAKGFAMYNLIGQKRNESLTTKNLFYHWYGKNEVRAGRKMGHVNALARTPDLALKKIQRELK